MKAYTVEEMKVILDAHAAWVRGEGGKRADLYGANLYGADLYGANLRGANLYGANLYGADLYGADLRGANLYGANLYGANLRDANLRDADLRGANLYGANLYGANLRDANLRDANLRDANLRDAKDINLPPYSIVPTEGTFIGWKKVRGNVVLKLEIPDDARRVSTPIGRKCRADKVRVVAAYRLDGRPSDQEQFWSLYDAAFMYRVGETVVTVLDASPLVECTAGIHFYITRQEAEQHW